jgi:hypothetical protein
MSTRPKIADLPPGPAKTMDAMIEAAAKPFAEVIGVSLEDAKRAVQELIDKGLAKIEVEGIKEDPETWRARLILPDEGSAYQ